MFAKSIAVIAGALILTSTALGAESSQRMTTLQAASAVRSQTTLHSELTAISCAGTGHALKRTFSQFKCYATYSGQRRPVWVRVRSKGMVCANTSTSIPAGCMAKGPRVLGSNVMAGVAFLHNDPSTAWASWSCEGFGAGYFICSGNHPNQPMVRWSVTFTPSGAVLKQL